MDDKIERYLGTEGPEAFDSEWQIRDYFKKENLISMFGPGDYSDAPDVMGAVIERWEAAQ
jgi:hypothetical protein